MKRILSRTALGLVALLASAATTFAQERGDALQLFSYGVSPTTRPNVSDGQIAASLDPDDWQAAYVRVMRMGINGSPSADPRPLTMLIGNDQDSLYIGVAVQLPNASIDNRLTLFFDQGTLGALEGSAGSPGEYYVSARANGTFLEDGHWNGTAWVPNPTRAARGIGIRKGTSAAERLYNFEFAFPLSKLPGALNSYLNINAGDEIGVFPRITLNTGDVYYWLDANGSPTDPSLPAPGGVGGWGQILTLGTAIADRNVVSLAALGIVPTIDGVVAEDPDWRFGFQKDIVLTDLAGTRYDATLRLKETSGPDNLIVGLSIDGLTPAPADYLAVYFDEGPTGGDRDFVLSAGDNAARVTGAGAFQDWNFDSNNWVADASSQGSGAAAVSPSGAWEVEMSVPFSTGQANDLNVVPEDELGALLEYYESATGKSYWWSATINDKRRVIDPVDPVYNALGWGFLQTGGPFIQPIYPERNDVLSGEYPLAVYALDPSDPDPGYGIERIRYEIRFPDPSSGSVTILGSGELTRVVDPAIPIWTATLNTAEYNVSPSDQLVLVYEVFDGEVDPVTVPIEVRIDNSGSTANLSDPDVSVDAPSPNSVLSGMATIEYSASTNEFLTLDTVELIIDGAVVDTQIPGSVDTFSGSFEWNTTTERNGDHVIQVRASNSLGFQSISPAHVVIVENDGPAVAALALDDADSILNADDTVTATATDADVAIQRAEYFVDTLGQPGEGTAMAATDGAFDALSEAVTAPLPIGALDEGQHTVFVRAQDAAGVWGPPASLDFVVDRVPPAIQDVTVMYPDGQDAARDGQTIVFTALVTDATAGLGTVVLDAPALDASAAPVRAMVDDGTGGDGVAGDGVYTATLVITQPASGDFGYTVRASDVVGNTGEVSGSVMLDNDAPVFTSLEVQDADHIYANGETVSLLATFDAAGYAVSADFFSLDDTFVAGSENVEDLGDGTYAISYTISASNGTANGTYAVTATATDGVGNMASGSVDVVLDNSGAVVTDLALDDTDDILNADDTMTATATDEDNAIQAAEYFVDVLGEPGEGTAMAASDGAFDSMSEGVTAALPIAALDEGQHTLFVRAQDVTGVWGPPASLDFVVDRVPPAIQDVTVMYPDGQDAARDGQTLVFTALVTDATAGLDTVTLTAADLNAGAVDQAMFDDGTNGDAVAGDDVYTAEVVVATGLTGEFPFTIVAADIVPNESSVTDEGAVVLDNSAPEFQSLVVLDADNLYADGETVSLLATFDESGYDVGADFSAIDDSYVAGTEDVEDLGDGTYRIRYTISHTNGRPDGTYAVTVTATDAVGNTASGSVDLELDNTGAVVTALDLDDEDLILNTDAVIFATVTDDEHAIQAAEYYVDVIGLPGEGIPMDPVDGAFDSMTEEVTAPLSIAALSEGQHTLYVRAQDVTGKWGKPLALDFLVDRVPPAIQNVAVVYPEGQTAARDGQTVLFTALVTDATSGLNMVWLTAADVNPGAVDQVMVDDGSNGDLVAGDDVYTAAVEVSSGKTGVFSFTIAAEDIVPNATSRTGSVKLDNEVPTLSVDVQPAPRGGSGLSGEVYTSEVVVDGTYADAPQADFIESVRIHVRNADGHEINNSPFVIAPTEGRSFSRLIHLVEGVNDVLVSVYDKVGNQTDVTFTLTRIVAQETDLVGEAGGTVISPDGTTVWVPPGALLDDYEITIERFPVDELPKPLDDNVTLVGAGHRFGPEGLVFRTMLRIRLTYADADLDLDQDGTPDFDESALSVFYWDGTSWIKTDAAGRSPVENFVELTTNHFSVYALGVDEGVDEFHMYWTRNPFRASDGTTAVMELPGSGHVTLRVFDLEGDLVRTIADHPVSGSTNVNWDGMDDFGGYVGSGIYIYLFEYTEYAGGGKRVIRKPIGVVQ